MENSLKKKRIRNIIIGAIILLLIVIFFLNSDFKQADTESELKSQITLSEKSLKDVTVGNNIDEYSQYVVTKFESNIAEAKIALDEKKNLSKAYKTLIDGYNLFKQSSNKNVMLPEELANAKAKEKNIKKTITYNDTKIVWEVPYENIFSEEPSNLDVFLENEKVIILNNGDLSFEGKVTIPYNHKDGKVQLFRLEEDSKNSISGIVKDGNLIFNAKRGGEYACLEVSEDGKINKKEKEKLRTLVEDKKEKNEIINQIIKPSLKPEIKPENKPSVKPEDKPAVKPDENGNEEGNSNKPDAQKPTPEPIIPDTGKSCTVTIRCDTIADQKLITNDSIRPFVPSDGVILANTTVELHDGDTAYDVLRRACERYGLKLNAQYNTTYNSAYVIGINHINEKDAGEGSGWMYKVNGTFPNYGCSAYVMKNNDHMSWEFTCNYGMDIGGGDAIM